MLIYQSLDQIWPTLFTVRYGRLWLAQAELASTRNGQWRIRDFFEWWGHKLEINNNVNGGGGGVGCGGPSAARPPKSANG